MPTPRRARFLDTDHPVFRPLWVRIAVVAAAVGWGLFEFAMGAPFWGVVFVGLGLYAAWGFYMAPATGAADTRPASDTDAAAIRDTRHE